MFINLSDAWLNNIKIKNSFRFHGYTLRAGAKVPVLFFIAGKPAKKSPDIYRGTQNII